jgi:hypothetical protein
MKINYKIDLVFFARIQNPSLLIVIDTQLRIGCNFENSVKLDQVSFRINESHDYQLKHSHCVPVKVGQSFIISVEFFPSKNSEAFSRSSNVVFEARMFFASGFKIIIFSPISGASNPSTDFQTHFHIWPCPYSLLAALCECSQMRTAHFFR